MTTSYELSLRLKKSGVPQEGGEYYWVYHIITDKKVLSRQSQRSDFFVEICRALTLGELVRELGKHIEFEILFLNHKHGKEVFARRKNYFTGRCSRTEKEHAPEEAAGELWAELLKQENQKA